ncbi:hypothetical protein M8J77_016237 [Diaphorina citri]|nr:hypothetical protein M8J77_016237 [Diaphorina citri]
MRIPKRNELVDGVVTQDSDVFLYGAVKVYRHFNTSCAGGGSVDTYHMDEIQSRLGLGRNKLIALSLLCGCDYNKGVSGVGKESALKFFQSVHDGDILDRIQSWRQNTHMDNIDVKKDKSISPELKCELQIRAKALQDPDFPCRELLAEFLQNDHKEAPRVKFQWSKPNVNQFLKLADIKLAWDSTYALEKVLPLLTRWHLTHTDSSLTPELVLNAKTTRGIKGYVVKWSEFDLNTEEPQALFEAKYPEVVRAFLETKAKGKKKAAKKNKENDPNEIPKPKTKRGKAKTNTDTDILHEINTDYNADFPSEQSQHIEKDKSTNENRTKPEKTKKEIRKKNPKTENTKKRADKSKKENKGAVDIRTYFLTKSTETAPDGIEDIDESINLLNTSLNSLSINTNRINSLSNRYKEASDIEHLDKEAIDIKHDMSSIIIEDTDTHRMKRDVLDISNIIGDVSMNGSLSNRIAGKSDNLWETSDYRNVDNVVGDTSMNESLPIDKATARKLDRVLQETREYRKEDEISKGEDKAESVHLIDDHDILNYSFNTACKIMSKEHKQDQKREKKQPVLDDFDELADIGLTNDRSENLSSKCSEKIRNLTFSDISMTNGSKIDIFNVVADDLASNKTRMNITNEMDDNSRTKRDTNTCKIFTNSYVILDDSLVENKINFNDSLVENKINFISEKVTNISEIKHNSPNKKPETTNSSKMCDISIISNVTIDDSVVPNKIDITDMNESPKKFDKLNDTSLILLDSFNTKTMDFADFESHPNQSKERIHHNQSLESMSFTETTLGNCASPIAMEQSPKFSQANFSYEKFSDSKLSDWNTSSPLVRHKLPLVIRKNGMNMKYSVIMVMFGIFKTLR